MRCWTCTLAFRRYMEPELPSVCGLAAAAVRDSALEDRGATELPAAAAGIAVASRVENKHAFIPTIRGSGLI